MVFDPRTKAHKTPREAKTLGKPISVGRKAQSQNSMVFDPRIKAKLVSDVRHRAEINWWPIQYNRSRINHLWMGSNIHKCKPIKGNENTLLKPINNGVYPPPYRIPDKSYRIN